MDKKMAIPPLQPIEGLSRSMKENLYPGLAAIMEIPDSKAKGWNIILEFTREELEELVVQAVEIMDALDSRP